MSKNINKTILLLVTIAIVILLYHNNLYWLASKWIDDPDYSHGPLIPLIALYIGWLKRDKLLKIKEKDGSLVGLAVITFAVILQVLSIRAEVNLTSSYSFIIIIYGIILTFYGKEVTKVLSFPIAYLVFMVPFLSFFIEPISNKLKLLSAYFSAKIIYLAGVPVFREGVTLNFPLGSIEVADPCSGIRSIISLVALGTVFAYFTETSFAKKIVLVISTIPLAVLGNLSRIIFTGLMTNAGVNVTEGFVHTLAGLLVFMVALVGLAWLRTLLKWKKTE